MTALTRSPRVQASGDTTGTTDRATFQAAIDAVAALGGGDVEYEQGLTINAPIVGKRGVHLKAIGAHNQFAPHVRLAPGSNCAMLTLAEETTGFITTGGVWDGDRFNQPGTAGGFVFDTEYYGGIFGSAAFNKIDSTIVQFTAGDGIRFGGTGSHSGQVENRIIDAYVYGPSGTGVKVSGSDGFIRGVTVAEPGMWGFDLSGSDYRIADTKAYYCGRMRNERDASTGVSDGNGNYGGYIINVQGIQATNLSSQDNSGAALSLSGQGGHIQVHSDGDGVGAGTSSVAASISYCKDMVIDLTISGTSGHNRIGYPVRFGTQTSGNRVRAIASEEGCLNPTVSHPSSTPGVTDRVSIGAANI